MSRVLVSLLICANAIKVEYYGSSFTVTSSELLIDAPILAVRRDSVTMPNNSNAYREIVEHFGAVAVAAVQDEKSR